MAAATSIDVNQGNGTMAVDGNGDVILSGYYNGTVNFDPTGTHNLTSGGSDNNNFVAKYSGADGSYVWAKSIGGSGNMGAYGEAVTIDSNNNVYVGGMTQSASFNIDPAGSQAGAVSGMNAYSFFVDKLDSSGTFVWGKTGTSTDRINVSNVIYDNGITLLAGYAYSNITSISNSGTPVSRTSYSAGFVEGFGTDGTPYGGTAGPANTAPTYVTGTAQSLSLPLNSAAVDLKSYLHVNDADASQTETWTQSVAPSHGTLSFSSATASSGSADITPGGTITYTPTTGYSGTDTFTIQVADGQGGTATRVFNITVAANIAPTYVTGTAQSLSLPFNSAAVDLKPYLHANDSDTGQTETWSQSVAPSHGSLSFSSATAVSGGADITPGGTITYTPTADYSGTDTFTIQVGDGTATVTRTFNVTVAARPVTVTPPPPPSPTVTPAAPPVVVAPPAAPPTVVEPPRTIVRDATPTQVFAPPPPISEAPKAPDADSAKTAAPIAPVVVAPPAIPVVVTAQFTAATVADGGFRVPVVTATPGGPAVEGLVALRPEIQTPTITDGPVRITLPLDAFAHTRSDAVVIRADGPIIATSYVAEDDLERIKEGDAARFIPHGLDHAGMAGTVLAIDRNPVKLLTDPALASLHGGDIPVRAVGQTLVPQGGFFRVTIRLVGPAPDIKLIGHAIISGQGQSLIGRAIRSALVVLVREWGA